MPRLRLSRTGPANDSWPPLIPREALGLPQGNQSSCGAFYVFLGLLYFSFAVFLIFSLVPPCRDFILAIERQHDFTPEPAVIQRYFYLSLLYYAPPFRFAAGCLAVSSAAGSIIALWQFAVAVNKSRRFILPVICLFASVLPGSLSVYLAYCELPYG